MWLADWVSSPYTPKEIQVITTPANDGHSQKAQALP